MPFDYLNNIPDLVWSGIFASTITVSGVLFSDWRNSKRLLQQHDFTERENERARTMMLRKEVYLPVAGALSKLQAYMMTLPNRDGESDENPTIEFAEACAKLCMVSTTETAILTQRLAADYNVAYLALSSLATGVIQARSDAELHKKYKDKAQAEFDRVSLEIDKFLESANHNEILFEALRQRAEWFEQQRSENAALEADALQRVAVEFASYLHKALDVVAPLSEAGVQLLVCVRRELGQDTDIDQLALAMQESRERTMTHTKLFLLELEKSVCVAAEK